MNITEISNNTDAIIEALAFNEDVRLLLAQCQKISLIPNQIIDASDKAFIMKGY